MMDDPQVVLNCVAVGTRRVATSMATTDGTTPEKTLDMVPSEHRDFARDILGVPPRYMLDMGKARGVVAALVGAKEHAVKQVEAGVDVLVVAGPEAGGHCGEVSTMVLVPEVLQAIEGRDTPVLAAGGIVTGRGRESPLGNTATCSMTSAGCQRIGAFALPAALRRT